MLQMLSMQASLDRLKKYCGISPLFACATVLVFCASFYLNLNDHSYAGDVVLMIAASGLAHMAGQWAREEATRHQASGKPYMRDRFFCQFFAVLCIAVLLVAILLAITLICK